MADRLEVGPIASGVVPAETSSHFLLRSLPRAWVLTRIQRRGGSLPVAQVATAYGWAQGWPEMRRER